MPQVYLYTGTEIDIFGVIMVYYFGRLIAVINGNGDMLWRDPSKPKFLTEYLLQLPNQDAYRWN